MAGKINDRKYMAEFSKTRHIIPVLNLPVADLSSFLSEDNKFSTEISVFCYLLKTLFAVTSIIQK